jgi:hypothetical protein
MKRLTFLLSVVLLAGIPQPPAHAGVFVAYSLSEAQRRCAAGTPEADVVHLGGITDLAGMVYDQKQGDLIIVGQANQGRPELSLSDFVVALRAVHVHGKAPQVSIERSLDTPVTNKLVVRWEGGIENSQLGKDMVEADILLKNIALAQVPAEIWGVPSYVSMKVEHAQKNSEEGHIASRFSYKNYRPSLAVRDGVCAIMELDVGIETEVMSAEVNGKPVKDLSGIRDEVGEAFAKRVQMNLSDLSTRYTILARARPILALVSLAEGIKQLDTPPSLGFWLRDYPVLFVETPKEHDRIKVTKTVGGQDMTLTVTGGIQLNPIVVKLQKGYVTALRDAVLNSRPAANVLTWNPPLDGWRIPGTENLESSNDAYSSAKARSGFSLDSVLSKTGRRLPASTSFLNTPLPPLNAAIPEHRINRDLPIQTVSDRVGGVMLQGAAQVEGAGSARVNLAGGGFSLVVDGQNARLSPEAFRKFITALWAVYYGDRDPGISIDPIAPGVNKHMVRYIGKVINSDLGRVMREADYLMKQWAVGTGRPDVTGFQNPDDIAAQRRVIYVGAMSRFWFVPEDMRFKRAGDLLLFDKGRMTVKTEFMFNNDSMRADPANERFAQFFTDRYTDIAQKYPVYQELFEYAKMVSLAKYLKESGVPLFWFLMANKDLVLTEDSPGTVDALAKGSDYFRNVSIEGGVDLATQGQYVYDAEAMKAVTEALSKSRPSSTAGTTLGTPDVSRSISNRFSFDLGGQAYSVLPQHSLTCGKDRRGIRYQTDIAFRDAGFCLTEQALSELDVRITRTLMAQAVSQSTQPSDKASEEETLRWYRTLQERATEQAKPVRERLIALKDRKYPTEQEFAQAIDKTLTGHEGADWIKPMVIKEGYYNTLLELVRYFNPKQSGYGDFGEGWHLMIPYRIRPASHATKEWNGVLVPEQVTVQNLVTGDCETLTFSKDRYSVVGYVPEKVGTSQVVGLFLMTDASFRLADKLGNEFWFDPAGRLTDMAFSEQHRMHFEYADNFTDQFDQPPYRVERASEERVEFQGVSLSKIMAVVDSLHGTREALVFDPTGSVVGYVPRNQAKTRFQILAVLSDLSFRLVDKSGNEVAFGPDGKFKGMSLSADALVVKSIGVGPYTVNFGYTMGRFGSPLVAKARLSKQGAPGELYAVRYEYSDDGQLLRAGPMENRVAQSASLGEDKSQGARL